MKNGVRVDCEKLIGQMIRGNECAIITGALSALPLLNLSSIIYGTKYRITDTDFIRLMRGKLSVDDSTVYGVQVRCFAIAALDVLKIQKYTGDDATVKQIVASQFDV